MTFFLRYTISMNIIFISLPALITPDTKETLKRQAKEFGADCAFIAENSEGSLVTAIQNAYGASGVVLSAGDYAYYSIAIRDAISSIEKTPVVEVSLLNFHEDDASGHASVLSAVCAGVISGFGQSGYSLALRALFPEL